MSDELTPITRKETFLAKAGGQNVVTPTPITREETFLQAIIDNGSGGGGGTGGGVLTISVTTELGYAIMDKTWNEINNAAFSVAISSNEGEKLFMPVVKTEYSDGEYNVTIAMSGNDSEMVVFNAFIFSAESADGYPQIIVG